MKLIPKKFGPLTVKAPLTVGGEAAHAGSWVFTTQAGHCVPISPIPSADGLSPTDLLMAAIASCIAISMQMACKELFVSTGDVGLVVTARKAMDAPSRIEQCDVEVSMSETLPDNVRDRLFERTKELCTISHSVSATVNLFARTTDS